MRTTPILAATLAALALAPSAAHAIPGCGDDCPPPNSAPSVSLGSDVDTAVRGQSVTFTADAVDPDGDDVGYAWKVDGAVTADHAAAITRAFATLGTHTVRVTVNDGNGGSAFDTDTVDVVDRAPVAGIVASTSAPRTGDGVTLTSSSSDPDGDSLTCSWDRDANGTFEATGCTTTASFAKAGAHAVKLRVEDPYGMAAEKTVTITAQNRTPNPAFTFGPDAPLSGEDVSFDSAPSGDPDGTIVARMWDLDGDGQFETNGASPHRSYAVPGAHQVTLRTIDDDGGQAEVTKTVTVGNRAPVAAFTAPDAAEAGTPVALDASGAADPEGRLARLEWDLDGDGTYETDAGLVKTRSVTFATPGTKTVRLRVSDQDGGSAIATRTITVKAKPTANTTSNTGTSGGGQNPTGGDQPAAGGQTPAGGSGATGQGSAGTPAGTTTPSALVLKPDARFARKAGKTVVTRLKVAGLPAGAKAALAVGRATPKALEVKAGVADASRSLKNRALKRGTTITIKVTLPGGAVTTLRWTVGKPGTAKLVQS